MATLSTLTPDLLRLSPLEKAQAIQLLSQSLADTRQGIEKTPGICGGRACIINTRIPVWVLINAQRLGISEAELLQDYPTLSAADLVNAWAYAERFKQEIEQDIKENEELE